MSGGKWDNTDDRAEAERAVARAVEARRRAVLDREAIRRERAEPVKPWDAAACLRRVARERAGLE